MGLQKCIWVYYRSSKPHFGSKKSPQICIWVYYRSSKSHFGSKKRIPKWLQSDFESTIEAPNRISDPKKDFQMSSKCFWGYYTSSKSHFGSEKGFQNVFKELLRLLYKLQIAFWVRKRIPKCLQRAFELIWILNAIVNWAPQARTVMQLCRAAGVGGVRDEGLSY